MILGTKERTVLTLLCDTTLRNKNIADRMKVSEKCVEQCRVRLYRKYHVHCLLELLRKAYLAGDISESELMGVKPFSAVPPSAAGPQNEPPISRR